MTVASTTRKTVPVIGNSVTTAYPFAFKVFTKADISFTTTVIATGVSTTRVLDSDYSVVLNADQDNNPGGTVTFPISGSPMDATTEAQIVSNVIATQALNLPAGGGAYNAQVVEDSLDKALIVSQQLIELGARSLTFPPIDTNPGQIPSAITRANKYLAFDGSGNPVAVNGSDGTLGSLAVALATSAGATLIGWIQTGVSAVIRTINDKLRDTVHFKDFGVVSGAAGVPATNDAAIAACLAAHPFRTIHATGQMNISATVFLDGTQRVLGEGGMVADEGVVSSTYFKKSATMATVAAVVGSGAILDGVGMQCVNGSTNGGLQLRGNSARARNIKIVGAGKAVGATGVGCRVGDTPGTNSNSWRLYNVIVTNMTGDAFWLHDGKAAAPDCNNGLATLCQALSNGGKGLVIDNATLNTIDTFLEEANDGWGVDVGSGAGITSCSGNVIHYGDSEANVAGQIRFGVNSNQNIIHASGFASVTDNGYFTKRYDRYNSSYRDFTPSLWGSTGTAKVGTAVTVVGSVATWTCVGHGYANGQTVVIGLTAGAPNVNLAGAFVISNVTANTFDVTVRTDQSITKPVTNAGPLVTSLQACGTYTAQHGRYRMNGSSIDGDFTLTSSAIANLTGVIGFVLPWDTAVIAGGVGPTTLQSCLDVAFYSGITHTGKLALPIAHDGGRVKFIQKSIGSGLVPVQLAAADIAAATSIITSFSYQFFKET